MANYDEKKKQREKEREKAHKKQNSKWNQEAGTKSAAVSYWLLAPLIIIFSFIPLALQYYEYDPKLQGFDWYAGSETQIDLFLHCKTILLILVSIYIIGALIYLFLSSGKKLECPKAFIPLGLYAVLSLISAFISDNSYFSFHGIFEQFEPVWVLIGYCLTVYYAFLIIRTEGTVRKIMKWFIAGIAIMFAIGVAQGLGHDPLSVDFVQALFSHGHKMRRQFEADRVYLTLYNPNYVGVYVAMILPIVFGILIAASKMWQKLLCAVLLVAGLFVLYKSGSKAGLLTLGICLLLLILFYRNVKGIKMMTAGIVLLLVVSFVGINALNDNLLINNIKSAVQIATAEPSEYPLESIETLKDKVRITYRGEALEIFRQQEDYLERYVVIDDKKQVVDSEFDEEQGCYVLQDERFPFQLGRIETEDFQGFCVVIDGFSWLFSNQMEEGDTRYYVYRTTHANPMTLKKDTTKYNTFLDEHPHFLSGRGYIWSRTLPLIKKYIWLGSGPDTFVIAYPNDDLVQRVNNGFGVSYTTKPHNMYLQQAVQTGMLSLICLLIFFGWYLVDSFKLYWKRKHDNYLSRVGVCFMVGVIGFLIATLTNDSMVVMTPVFYVILGTGMGINASLKNTENSDLGEKRERK